MRLIHSKVDQNESAMNALNRLILGNQRYVAEQSFGGNISSKRRIQLTEGQNPFAVIVGCSDSRVPAELVFDQGLGDLFVIRVAGNITDELVTGSVEYAVAVLGCELVVVLGHTDCGAVKTTLQEISQPSEKLSPNLGFIVNTISSAVRSLTSSGSNLNQDELVNSAIRANIKHSAQQLYATSTILESAVNDGTLIIAGAEYHLLTGEVEFLDQVLE